MGALPTQIRLDLAATGNSADGQIHRNAVDDAFGAMASKLLLLLRADTINVAQAGILDAMGNPITALTTGTKNSANSNFNGLPSITPPPSSSKPYTSIANSLGNPSAGAVPTLSYTVLAGIHIPSSPTGSAMGLYGDNLDTSDGGNVGGAYMQSSNGNLVFIVGGSGSPYFVNTPVSGLSLGETIALWLSWDNATKILRVGINGGGIAYQTGTIVNTRTTGNQTTALVTPFSEGNGAAGGLSFHRWALFNKAFMNGSVPADDAQFSALVSAYANLI